MISIWSRIQAVAKSRARSKAGPTGGCSRMAPVMRPRMDRPVSDSKAELRTCSSTTGCSATSKAQNHLTWALADPASSVLMRQENGTAAAERGSHLASLLTSEGLQASNHRHQKRRRTRFTEPVKVSFTTNYRKPVTIYRGIQALVNL